MSIAGKYIYLAFPRKQNALCKSTGQIIFTNCFLTRTASLCGMWSINLPILSSPPFIVICIILNRPCS